MDKIEEAQQTLAGWLDHPLRNTWVKAKTRDAADAVALAMLDEAEAAYANNYEGANEGDDVAMAIEALRTRIKEPGDGQG